MAKIDAKRRLGERRSWISRMWSDGVAGLTLATITIPEQMATARLGGFDPQMGLYAFVAATVGFALFGRSRTLTIGADSTITPIFAGSLAMIAAGGATGHEAAAMTLSLLVGLTLCACGLFKLGWLSNLLSIPVLTGFLAGVSAHILASQLPIAFGVATEAKETLPRLAELASSLFDADWRSAVVSLGVLAVIIVVERVSPRLPGALIAVVTASIAAATMGLATGSATSPTAQTAAFVLPAAPSLEAVRALAPLALMIAMVVMMQTAAVSRAFPDPSGARPDIDRDIVGVGAGNLLSGLVGAFPVNASPPRTAIVVAAGGQSQAAPIVAAVLALAMTLWGDGVLSRIPHEALAGVLLYAALRILRFGLALQIARQAPAEGALVVATALAIIVLPIQSGVAIGVALSCVHGFWTVTRAVAIPLEQAPGTTIWWPARQDAAGLTQKPISVVAFQTPLLFANAETFKEGLLRIALQKDPRPKAVVLEMGGVADIDFTAAQSLIEVIRRLRPEGIDFAIARLESVRGEEALRRMGVISELGEDHLFRSVDDAVKRLSRRAGR